MNNYVHIAVRPETKKLLVSDCVKIYLSYHPHLKGMNISQEHILFQVAGFFKEEYDG